MTNGDLKTTRDGAGRELESVKSIGVALKGGDKRKDVRGMKIGKGVKLKKKD